MVEHYWLAVNDDRQVGQLSLLPIPPHNPHAVTWTRSRKGVDSIHKLGYTRLQSNRTFTANALLVRCQRCRELSGDVAAL